MRWWLKVGYFTDAAEADADYWLRRPFVGDGPGRVSPRWKTRPRPRRGQLYPPHGPRYEVGDRLVIYVTGIGKCPAILEVTGEPRWDPERVDRDDRPGEGDQWGVVTPVGGISAVRLDDAPALELLGMTRGALRRKGHVRLEEWQYREAERLIAGRRRRSGKPPLARDVPIEAGTIEGYEVLPSAGVRRAVRREARLQHDYASWMEAQGESITRKQIAVPGGTTTMYSDIFNKGRNQLIEAKAGTDRNDVRMAIGQLADYGRFAPGAQQAVLWTRNRIRTS